MTVPQEVRLARHAGDLDPDGHDTLVVGDAADITIADSGGYFTATDVEAALAELAKKDIGYQSHGAMGASETFDALTGWHSGTLNASCAITFTGATSGLVASMVLEFAVDSGGPYTETWPGAVVWPGGTAPTLAASTTYVLLFMSRDGGSTWYGFVSGASGPDLSAIDFLVGTASGLLSGEIVVGTTPGGELGGTWASPTVDTTHSGSTHAATQAAAEATAAAALAAHVAASGTGSNDHVHVAYETHTSDGATVTFTLDQVYQPGSVTAWNRTTGARLGVTEVAPDQATISAAGTAADLLDFDYAAATI